MPISFPSISFLSNLLSLSLFVHFWLNIFSSVNRVTQAKPFFCIIFINKLFRVYDRATNKNNPFKKFQNKYF